MKSNLTKIGLLALAVAFAPGGASAASFNASLIGSLYRADGTTVVNSAQVSFGYFDALSVATVTSAVSSLTGDGLVSYYHSNFTELYRANISGGALNYIAETDGYPVGLANGVGDAMWAAVFAPNAGGGYDNGLFVLTDTLADPDYYWSWTSAGSPALVSNTFLFDTVLSGEATPEDFSFVSLAAIGTSSSSLRLSSLSSASAIPEPASGSLFLLGTAGVLALRRLRKTNV